VEVRLHTLLTSALYRGRQVKFTFQPLYPQHPLDSRLDGLQSWFVHGGKGKISAPTGN